MCRTSGTEPVTVFRKLRSHLPCRTCITACWIIRSSTVGMPSLTHPSVRLGYLYPPHRLRLVGSLQAVARGWLASAPSSSLATARPLCRRCQRLPLFDLHSLPGLQAILPPAHLFHQSLAVLGRAFRNTLRRERFGPFTRRPQSFTLRLLAKGQPITGFFCRFSLIESRPLLAASFRLGLRPLARLICPLLTSAARSG